MARKAPPTIDLERALFDPTAVFQRPSDVVKHRELARRHKIAILRCWAYDATELSVAEEEGTGGGGPGGLDAVLAALNSLAAHSEPEHAAPTKHAVTRWW